MKSRLLSLTLVLMIGFTISSAAQIQTQNSIGLDYLLKSGDSIAIVIAQQSTLSRDGLVIVDGKVDLPLLGPVQAAGLTPAEFRQIVQGRYARYIDQPHITLVIDKRLIVTDDPAKQGIYRYWEGWKPGNVLIAP